MLHCNVKEFGARGDGICMDTAAVQRAIDTCSAAGGGRVTLEAGRFLCGRLDLKSGVDLHIETDAVLQFSDRVEDFPEIETTFWNTDYAPRFNRRCMLYAEDCDDIALTGRGTIDCSGDAWVEPMTPEMIATHPHQSYFRKPFPNAVSQGKTQTQLDHLTLAVKTNPALTSLAPARVVLFIGCRNVLVEDVRMIRQPAGWSYWICGCEDVSFHRAGIQAAVDMPNNDGIHINCSRRVTVSDCNIITGDDCIVVRAYSAPLGKDTPCESVCVTNCNLRSHACAIRVGWIGDGVMRNLAFSNLTITDSCVGIGMRLPGNPTPNRLSDEGTESTLIENVSFSNIVIDRNLRRPVNIEIGDPNRCTAIRQVYFSHLHARGAKMPCVSGRADCHVQDVVFSDCHFIQIPYEEMHTFFGDRFAQYDNSLDPPRFRFVDRLQLNATEFSVL